MNTHHSNHSNHSNNSNHFNNNASNVLNLGYFKSKLITDVKLKNYIINMIYANINVYNFRYKIIDSNDILDNIKKK